MIVYYILFVLILANMFCVKRMANNQYDTTYHKRSVGNILLHLILDNYILIILALLIVSAFRDYTVGLDNHNYLSYFSAISQDVYTNWGMFNFEYGYRAINWIAMVLGIGYNGLQLLVAMVVCYGFARFINAFSVNKGMSWLLFLSLGFFAQSLNIMRQMCAVAFILIAIIYLHKKKYFWYIVFTVIASLFHQSALLSLIILPIWFIPLNKITVAIYGVLTCLVSITFIPIVRVLAKILGGRYLNYILQNVYNESAGLADILFTLGLLAVFIVMFLLQDRLVDDKQSIVNGRMLSLFYIVPLIRTFGAYIMFPALVNRLSPYFFFAILLLVPNYIKGIKDRYNKWYNLAFIVLVVLCLIYMYFYYAVKLACGVVPYEMMIFN